MFIGRHDHTIDPKGRVSVPSEYRTGLQRDSDDPPVLARLPGGCLALYPWQAWLENEGRIARMQAFRPELYSLQRFLLEGVARCPVDRQGRVLVPPRLREWAGLQREVVVLGAGPRVELWEPGRLEQDLARTGVNYGEYSALAGLGIRENPAGGAGGESPSG